MLRRVGVACYMDAGALTGILGGTVNEVENATEIGMEYNLGLTCDTSGWSGAVAMYRS